MPNILIANIPRQTANYTAALQELGAQCASLPDPSSPFPPGFCLRDFDGLILPGGSDIDPVLFYEDNQGSRTIDPLLDRTQLNLLHLFVLAGKPVLGICKGMQIINVYFGGTICQHLPTSAAHESSAAGDRAHPVTAVPGSRLAALYGSRYTVNSAHHQGVKKPGRQLAVTQTAMDRVIEGLEHTFLPILGVQWHPERMCFRHARTDTVDGSHLLKYFLYSVVTASGAAPAVNPASSPAHTHGSPDSP